MHKKWYAISLGCILGFFLPAMVFASTGTIDATNYRSRLCSTSDCSASTTVFWRTTNGTPVLVSDSTLTGYIWSSNFGWINLAPAHGGVHNTTGGTLSGYAWGSGTGWINFAPAHGGVYIDVSSGEFSGYAWASGTGWMHFDCTLGVTACVKTDWRPTSSGGGSSGGGGGTGGGGGGTTTTGGGTTTTGGGTTTTGGDGTTTGTGGTTSDGGGLTGTGGTTTGDGGGTTTTGGGTTTTGGGGTTTTGGGGTTTGGGGIIIPATTSGCTVSTATDTLGLILGEAKNSFCQTKQTIGETAKKLKEILATKEGGVIATTAAAVSVVGSGAVIIGSALFLNPISFSELFLIPVRLWTLLMTALGLKKRRRPWGTVYDSVTKQPLDPAYVTLRSAEGKDVVSTLTDLDGRYGFVVPVAGSYALVAQKTNYVFPSQGLVGHDHDELYRDLYFGEYFAALPGEVVIRNIPMDPEKFDWNEFAKKEQKLMKFYSARNKFLFRLADILFGIGFAVATLAVISAPRWYNILVFALYVTLFFIRKHGLNARPFGYVGDMTTGKPLSFAIVRVSYAETGVELIHRITDATGKYYCLLPNGSYVVQIDKKLPDGTYQTAQSNIPVTVDRGYLAKEFVV